MRRAVVWVLGGVTVLPAVASAQSLSQTAIDVQNFWPAEGGSQSITLHGSEVLPHLGFGFSLVGNYMQRPLVLREVSTGIDHEAVSNALTTDFVFGLGLFNRLQVGLAVPLVVAQSGEGISALVANSGPATQLQQTALRDVRFSASVAILQRARRTFSEGLGLRLELGGSIPTGDRSGFQGAPAWTFNPMAVADYRVAAGVTITVNAGARIRDQAAVGDLVWGSQVVAGVGVSYRPHPLDRLLVGVDYLGLFPVAPLNGYHTAVPMELYFGARYAVDRGRDVEITLGGSAPLANTPTVPEFRVLAGVSYWPHVLDNDNDGVLDADDRCPTVPEDRDGFEDADGCPDPDNDGDHIPDTVDRCPNEPEDVDNFEDEDGCPDPDNDHDGVLDPDDECATEPAGPNPDPRHPGCPIRDRDHDGVLDGRDQCIDVPQGEHPDPQRPGCPLPDADHDLVADAVDACPSDPAGAHPDRFRPGCPDPDRDHDGVPNEVDRCPDQPETINGVLDDDGCPDEGPEATSWAGNVLIFQRAIRLHAGARTVARADEAILAQAAQRIRGRGAEVERVSVMVVSAPGARNITEARRLAGLVARALEVHGVAAALIGPDAAPAPALAPGARPTVRAPVNVGEVRIRIYPRAVPGAPRVGSSRVSASPAPSSSPTLPSSSSPPPSAAPAR